MKLLVDNYAFDPVAKTVTFNEYTTLNHASLLLITNVTVGAMIYNFAKATQVVTIAGNIVTLNASVDTTGMSATDDLQIFYEDQAASAATDESVILLRRIAKLLEPIATQDANNRQRVAVEAMPTVAVSTVSNLATYGGIDPRYQFTDAARLTYAEGIRTNLQFS
jgi:hypothetical protein